ncbi:MAG TPA: hypothetical protein DCS93_02465 [Microscillaceae bacterium]|nr:hypothetical protein [Microscillaceae bacterium]
MAENHWDEKLRSIEMTTNPKPILEELRTKCPFFQSEYLLGTFVTKYKDVDTILKNTKTITANKAPLLDKQLQRAGVDMSITEKHTKYNEPALGQTDPPLHTKRRKVAAKAFTPKAVKGYEEVLTRIISEELDKLKGRTSFDLYKEFAATFPYRGIATLVGVPDDRYDEFIHTFHQIEQLTTGIWDTQEKEEVEKMFTEGNQANDDLDKMLLELAHERLKNPKEDMLSYMLAKSEQQEDEDTSIEAVASIASVLIATGSTSISYQVPLILYSLLQDENKDKFEAFKANLDNDEFIENAINEAIRLNPLLQFAYRIATEEMMVSGQKIEKDEILALSFASASVDPDVFPDPEKMDFSRENTKSHLGFGTGVHYCLGRHLAIKEMTIAFRELFARFPNLRLDPQNPLVFNSEVVALRSFSKFSVLV